jgi:hypothetical protein
MSDLRGLSKPPRFEVGSTTARFVSGFVVATVAVGAVGYVYVSAHTTHPAKQAVAMNETASLPSTASRVTPPIVSLAPAPAATPTPTLEQAPPPSADKNAKATATKAVHPLRTAHANSESFANQPTSDTPSATDSTQPAPAPALNAAPDQTAPQNNQVAPAQNASPQATSPASQPPPTPDQSSQQNTDPQNAPPQQTPPQPQ